jgi:transcriptional regulator with XRE-family HTH domain
MEELTSGKLRTNLVLRQAVGARFRQARERARISDQWVADKLGVNRTTVGYWERGRSFPSVEHLTALLRLYGISADWLLDNLSDDAEGEREQMHLANYRALDPDRRRSIDAATLAFLHSNNHALKEED